MFLIFLKYLFYFRFKSYPDISAPHINKYIKTIYMKIALRRTKAMQNRIKKKGTKFQTFLQLSFLEK